MELPPGAFLPLAILAIVVLAFVVWIVILVLTGLGHGLSALRAMRGQPNRPSLRLLALNLLEPSVTITLIFAFAAFLAGSNITLVNLLIWSLIAGIPQSLMLFAPFFAPATLPFRNTIALWGRLRWINAVLLWIAIFLSLESGIGLAVGFQIVAGMLVVSGVGLLRLSINKLVPIVRELRAIETV